MKLWPLPKSDHAVSSRSGLALVAAALCLLPIDLALAVYGWKIPVVIGTTMREGFEEPLHGIPRANASNLLHVGGSGQNFPEKLGV